MRHCAADGAESVEGEQLQWKQEKWMSGFDKKGGGECTHEVAATEAGVEYSRLSVQTAELVTLTMVRCTRKRARLRAEEQGGRRAAVRNGSGNSLAQ